MKYEELKLYLDKNMSLRQMSAESNKSYTSIRYWMKKYGLEANFKNFKDGHDHGYRQKIDGEGNRFCPYCQTHKKLDEFYKRRKENCSGHCKQCVTLQTIERGRRLKLACINYKGGKCQKCGYDKYQGALDFHHRNPEEKDFGISKKYRCAKLSDRIKRELDKCDLLCANCHREEHWILKEVVEKNRLNHF